MTIEPTRFGGSAHGPDQLPYTPLALMDANQYNFYFDLWLARRFSQTDKMPITSEELDAFDRLSVVPAFEDDYESQQLSFDAGGLTMEEMVNADELGTGRRVAVLISQDFADQPAGQIQMKKVLDSRDLINALIVALKASEPEVAIRLGIISRGRPIQGHLIRLFAADEQSMELHYLDPWPDSTLLAQMADDSKGIRRSERHATGWAVSAELLAQHVAFAVVPEALWEGLGFRPSGMSIQQSETTDDLYWAAAMRGKDCFSRASLASSALLAARAMARQGLGPATWRWLRQAAFAGSELAAHVLSWRAMQEDGHFSLEHNYWLNCLEELNDQWVPITLTPRDFTFDQTHDQVYQRFMTDDSAEKLRSASRLAATGQVDEAINLLQPLFDEVDTDTPAIALFQAAVLSESLGKMEQAAEWALRASLLSHPDLAPQACRLLAACQARLDRKDDAILSFLRVAFSGHPMCLDAAKQCLRQWQLEGDEDQVQSMEAWLEAQSSADDSTEFVVFTAWTQLEFGIEAIFDE